MLWRTVILRWLMVVLGIATPSVASSSSTHASVGARVERAACAFAGASSLPLLETPPREPRPESREQALGESAGVVG